MSITDCLSSQQVSDPNSVDYLCRYAIVQPIADKTSLHLESEGLAVLRDIQTPVAPVVVIGPYRSGKSFLLNQLLGVGCGKSL